MLFNKLLNALRSYQSQINPEVNIAHKIELEKTKQIKTKGLFFSVVAGLNISSYHPQVFPKSNDKIMKAGLSLSPTWGTCRYADLQKYVSKRHFLV